MTGSERKHLIVGIDPGTTAAYAILNMDGKILAFRSSRQLKLNHLIEETTGVGIPLIVGTDRKKCPGIINRYAAKTGAVKAIPDYDVPEAEKNAMTKGLEAQNSHQKDALAAAMVAYRQYEPLLKRIDRTLRKEGKEAAAEKVKSVVITRKISIRKALALIEENLPLIRAR